MISTGDDGASRSRRRRATNPSLCGTEGEGGNPRDEEHSSCVPCSMTNFWEGIVCLAGVCKS
jgi:hypothetical protein